MFPEAISLPAAAQSQILTESYVMLLLKGSELVSHVETLIERDDRLLSSAGCSKAADTGVVGIKKHRQRHLKHVCRPNIDNATVASMAAMKLLEGSPADDWYRLQLEKCF